ncbi:MAG: oligosaccharide flippase family protein, partial [Paludibacteraceae bacterium]|nr:oligosaccharide flippase family protein [Paludibacteraceae bacterium]
YWALAWQIFLQNVVRVLFLWLASSWRVSFHPTFGIIKDVFTFSSFMLFASFINTIVKNIYSVIIGRLFNPALLGFYSQANKYQQIPSTVIQSAISGVAYPMLSNLKSDEDRQLMYLRKIVKVTACAIFPIMFGLSALMSSLVSILLTDKWLPAVPYFQMLVPVAIVLPFHSLNLNLILIRGHSKVNFMLETIKNTLTLLSIFIVFVGSQYALGGWQFELSIEALLISFSVANVISYVCDSMTAQRLASYRVFDQFMDIAPYAFVGALMFLFVMGVEWVNSHFMILDSKIILVAIQMLLGVLFYLAMLKLLGSKVYEDIMDIVKRRRV